MSIKGAVIFDADRFQALAKAMTSVAKSNKHRDIAAVLYETPKTMNFVPASFGYPDRWFIHWDQLPHF